MATLNNLELYRGESATFGWVMSPVETTVGWTVKFTVRQYRFSPLLLLQLTATGHSSGGHLDLVLTRAQTLALGTGVFVYDLDRIDSGSEEVLSIGTLTILADVRNTA